jgi:hypothetical protein
MKYLIMDRVLCSQILKTQSPSKCGRRGNNLYLRRLSRRVELPFYIAT